jgi:hypothetical protein
MAVTCSEDAKQAINLISQRSTPGFSPVHVIEASWPMQRCAVNAQLSSERNLTLLEKYTLRSFNEIPNVSAAEIADRLGLKEPELIEEALGSLTRSEAIDSHQREPEDQSQQLREEIDLIEFQLNNNVFKGAVKNNQNRKLERLKQQLKQLEAPKKSLFKGFISNAIQRLMNFKAKVTEAGKSQLQTGKITEPTKRENLALVRCLGSEEVICVGVKGVSEECLSKTENWNPLTKYIDNASEPTTADITLALKNAGRFDNLVIQSFENQNNLNEVEFIDICITLTVSNEDKTAEFFVHRRGSSIRLKWIEVVINNDKKIEQMLLQRFSEMMKSKLPTKKVKSGDFNPLIYINRILNQEIGSDSRGMIVTDSHENLVKLAGAKDACEQLLRNRTTVNLSNTKGWKLEDEDEIPLRFELSRSGTEVPNGSISTANGTIYPAQISVKGKINTSLAVQLPVLCFDTEMGYKTITEVDSRLRNELDKRTCFLLSRSESDFTIWLTEQISAIKNIENMASVYENSRKLSLGCSFDVLGVIFDVLIDKRFDLFEKDVVGTCEKLVSILGDEETMNQRCWSLVEPYVQQDVFESIASGAGWNDLADTWQLHNNGKKRLPWEDAARLEVCRFGHCNSTKFEALRYFEDIVNELAGANEISTESVAISLAGLRNKGIIDEKTEKEAYIVRKDRNSFTHEVEINASLDYTLRVIKLMRELMSIGVERNDDSWKKPTNTKWEHTLSQEEVLNYISKSSEIISDAIGKKRSCNGSIWVNGLMQSMPSVFDNLPMTMIRGLYNAPLLTTRPTFVELIEPIARNSIPSWIESLEKPTVLEIPKNVQEIIDEFNEMGEPMASLTGLISEKYLANIQNPTNIEELVVELNNFKTLEKTMKPTDLNIRWKRSIAEKTFESELEVIEDLNPEVLEHLGKNNLDQLFRKSLRNTVSKISDGDVEGVKSVCERIILMIKSDELWSEIIKKKDGFIGAQCGEKIRKGGDLISLGQLVESHSPMVDKDVLPTTNTRFEEIISRGKIEEKKASKGDEK